MHTCSWPRNLASTVYSSYRLLFPEQCWRQEAQGTVWVVKIVVIESSLQLRHHILWIRPISQLCIVSLQCFYKALSHSIALRTGQRCGDCFESQLLCKASCLCCHVATALVTEPFNALGWCRICAKSILNSMHQCLWWALPIPCPLCRNSPVQMPLWLVHRWHKTAATQLDTTACFFAWRPLGLWAFWCLSAFDLAETATSRHLAWRAVNTLVVDSNKTF